MNCGTWGWEISEYRGGPHHYLVLEFNATETELARSLKPLLSEYFAPWNGKHQWKSQGSGSGCYSLIELQNNCITITQGWGNPDNAVAELLNQLLTSQPLQHWQVMAGGEGYNSQQLHSGDNLASFLEYCRKAEAKQL